MTMTAAPARLTANLRESREAAPARQGIAIRTVRGDELARDPAAWARDCFALHRASTDRMAWGMRWVNRRFYERVLATMPDAAEVVEARREGRLRPRPRCPRSRRHRRRSART